MQKGEIASVLGNLQSTIDSISKAMEGISSKLNPPLLVMALNLLQGIFNVLNVEGQLCMPNRLRLG